MALLPKRCEIPYSRLPSRCYDEDGHPNEQSRLPEPCSACPDCPDAPQTITLTIADLALCPPCFHVPYQDWNTSTLLSGSLNGTWQLTPAPGQPCVWTTAEPTAVVRHRAWYYTSPPCSGAPYWDWTGELRPRLEWSALYPKWFLQLRDEAPGILIFSAEAWGNCHQQLTFLNEYFCGQGYGMNMIGGGGTALMVPA